MAAVAIAWIAYLYAFVRFLFHGFRVGSLLTTALAFAGVFVLLIFLTCRALFRPTKRQRQAFSRLLEILSGNGKGGARR